MLEKKNNGATNNERGGGGNRRRQQQQQQSGGGAPRNSRSRNMSANIGEETQIAKKEVTGDNLKIVIEMKQNNRGKFVKLIDDRQEFRKSKINMSLVSCQQMREKLQLLHDEVSRLTEHKPEDFNEEKRLNRLKSESIIVENRRYYLDLKENARGRFVTIILITQRMRSQINVSADKLMELSNKISQIVSENCDKKELEENNSDLLSQLKSHAIKSDRRMFYFDVGTHFNGLFCRISEVTQNYRTAVNIPQSRWAQVRDILNEYVELSEKFGGCKTDA